MEALITHYGLLGVLVGAAVEGDVVVILSGVVAHLGLLPFSGVLAAGWFGAVAADCVWYTIGRRHAVWAHETQAYQLLAPRIEAVVGRMGAGEVLIARFIFGTRIASMLYWGIRSLPFVRFVALDMVGCAVWATVLTGLGYAFSGSATVLLGRVKRVEMWLLMALVIAAVVAMLARRLLRRSIAHRKVGL